MKKLIAILQRPTKKERKIDEELEYIKLYIERLKQCRAKPSESSHQTGKLNGTEMYNA